MKLDASSINEVLELQAKMQILDNKLLLFVYAMDKASITGIKHLQSVLDISNDDMGEYYAVLLKNDLTHKKDDQFFSKVMKTPTSSICEKKSEIDENAVKEDGSLGSYTQGAKEIIDHLAELVKINFRHTKKRLAILESKLMQGFTIEQCKMLNLYYYEDWSGSPEMKQHLTIETLYNEKFITRMEVSQKAFSELKRYYESIQNICEYYAAAYSSILYNKNLDVVLETIKEKNILGMVGLKPQRAIALWLDKGILEDEIKDTIFYCISEWSKNKELIAKISLTRILDSRFLERLEIVLRKKQLAQGTINLSSKKNAGINEWSYTS